MCHSRGHWQTTYLFGVDGISVPPCIYIPSSPGPCISMKPCSHCYSPPVHQMPSDFPTGPGHLTPTSTCSPVSHSPITPHSIYTSPSPPALGQTVCVGYILCVQPPVPVPSCLLPVPDLPASCALLDLFDCSDCHLVAYFKPIFLKWIPLHPICLPYVCLLIFEWQLRHT